jgi:hypothetical protein
MAATYKWSVGKIFAKKSFTDKNGNLRENVIKSVELIYEGVEEERKESREIIVSFPLFDLSSFQDYTQLNKEVILDWSLNKLSQREKSDVEGFVKGLFEESNNESNITNIEIDD